jgi:hypothetical protein
VCWLQQAILGYPFLSPPLTEDAIRAYVYKMQESVLDSYETMTTREREVLHLAIEWGN